MKTKKILKIICVVVAVLFSLTIVGGIVFTAVRDYNKQSNDSCTVAYADELMTTETVTNIFTVCAPTTAFPITFYGYNGTSKKSTVIQSNNGELTVTTTFFVDSDTPDYRRILSSGTISYMLAVDKQGYIMYVDLGASDDYITFPLTACRDNGDYIDLWLTYSYNDNGDLRNDRYDEGYADGYDKGYDIGKDEGIVEGETRHEEDYTDGYREGYDEGYTAGKVDGKSEGLNAGTNAGYSSGYNDGFDVGYDEGYADGENKSLSVQLNNPVSYLLEPVHRFMNTKFFGDLTYGSIFNVVMFVTVAIIFLKMFGGG